MFTTAMIVLAVVEPLSALRVYAWIAIPISLWWYLIFGHAPIYGWFLWASAIRDKFRSDEDHR